MSSEWDDPVRKGALVLDEHFPGWDVPGRVDLTKLDLRRISADPLGRCLEGCHDTKRTAMTSSNPAVFLVLDTETTGLPSDPKARPIQVGGCAVLVETGELLGPEYELDFMVWPDVWPADWSRAEKVHGISRERVEEHGLSGEESWHRLRGWTSLVMQHPGVCGREGSYTAWNASFDQKMLARWHRSIFRSTDFPLRHCLMNLYKTWCRSRGVRRSWALKKALEHFELPPQQEPHNALADARSAALVYRAMLERST